MGRRVFSQRRRVFIIGVALASLVELALCVPLHAAEGADPAFRPRGKWTRHPPITDFPLKSVQEASNVLNPSDVVIGVMIGNESRAYPVDMMMGAGTRYHVFNDTLGGKAIAATWCNLGYTAIVYARDVDARKLTFGAMALTWKHSFVMYDKETRSLWSHILGKAMQGPLRGKKLEQVPSVLTTWETWSRQHPEGTVLMLTPTGKKNPTEFYRDPERFVLGIAQDGKAKAWRFDQLAKALAVNDAFAGRPVVALCDPTSLTVRLYVPEADGHQLKFEAKGLRIRDRETGSTWDPVKGEGVDGPMKGNRLRPLPAVVSSRKTWYTAHPNSQ
jgi:hypothetical protein